MQASRAQELKRQELLAKQLDAGLITSLDTDGDGVNKLEFVVGADVENRGPSPLRGTSYACGLLVVPGAVPNPHGNRRATLGFGCA